MNDLPTTPGRIEPPPMGYIAARILDDGRILCVTPLTFGRARITLGTDWTGWTDGW
jgi:hypothetical protein